MGEIVAILVLFVGALFGRLVGAEVVHCEGKIVQTAPQVQDAQTRTEIVLRCVARGQVDAEPLDGPDGELGGEVLPPLRRYSEDV